MYQLEFSENLLSVTDFSNQPKAVPKSFMSYLMYARTYCAGAVKSLKGLSVSSLNVASASCVLSFSRAQ
jgi:hypothetical protein